MCKKILIFGCLLYLLIGCSELPSQASTEQHVVVRNYCASTTEAACGQPGNMSLGSIFR